MAEPNISKEVWIEDLEKLPDGSFKKKNHIAKAKNGTTFDDHLDDEAVHGIGDKTALKTTHKASIVGAVNELFTNVSNGKSAIATAITGKGVVTSGSDTFGKMAENINNIKVGVDIDVNKIFPRGRDVGAYMTTFFEESVSDVFITVTEYSSRVNMKGQAGHYNSAMNFIYGLVTPIDLTNYKTITLDAEISVVRGSYRDVYVNIGVTRDPTNASGFITASQLYYTTTTDNPRQEYMIDVSQLRGKYYFAFGIRTSGSDGSTGYSGADITMFNLVLNS